MSMEYFCFYEEVVKNCLPVCFQLLSGCIKKSIQVSKSETDTFTKVSFRLRFSGKLLNKSKPKAVITFIGWLAVKKLNKNWFEKRLLLCICPCHIQSVQCQREMQSMPQANAAVISENVLPLLLF